MKRILLILLLSLCGLTPAQKRVVLSGFSDSQCDNIIRAAGPTLWLDAEYGITLTATNTVSAWASRVGAVTFTQSTAANQPSLTRYDNLEARSLYSESISNGTYYQTDDVTYTASQADPFGGTSAVLFTTSGGSSRHFGGLPQTAYKGSSAAGESIRWCVYLKDHTTPSNYNAWIGFNDTTYKGIIVAPSTGAIVATGAGVTSSVTTIGGGWFRACATTTIAAAGVINTYIGFTATATTTDGPSVFDDDGEAIVFFGPQLQSSLADPTYIATTTYPVYRGMNGRRAVRFDGATDGLVSTAILSDVITASAAEIILAFRPDQVTNANNQYLFAQGTTTRFIPLIRGGAAQLQIFNFGGGEYGGLQAVVDQKAYVADIRHSGGNLLQALNGVEAAAVGSGDTTTLTGTLALGYYPNTPNSWYAGVIPQVLVFNKVLPSDTRAKINRCLCRKAGASC